MRQRIGAAHDLLGDALKMPIVRWVVTWRANAGAVDPSRDALRMRKVQTEHCTFRYRSSSCGCCTSGGRVVLNSIVTDMASVVTFYLSSMQTMTRQPHNSGSKSKPVTMA
jgi:hypothetical protein